MNPYATSQFVPEHVSPDRRVRVVRLSVWAFASVVLVAFVLHPYFIEVRGALGIAGYAVPFLPFLLYDIFCRVTPRGPTLLQSMVDSLGRFVLAFALPMLACEFILYLVYFLYYSFFAAHQLTTPPHGPILALSFTFGLLSTAGYDHYWAIWLRSRSGDRAACSRPIAGQ